MATTRAVVRCTAAAVVLAVVVLPAASVTAAPTAPSASAGSFVSLPAVRILDTRSAIGAAKGPIGGGQVVRLQVGGRGGVPVSGVSAVVLNVTVTQPTASGVVTVYPDGSVRPATSNLNFVRGQTVPNLVISRVGGNGVVDLQVATAGRAHLIADISGYYLSGAPAAPGSFTALNPVRLLDTRAGVGTARAAVSGGHDVHLQVAGQGGVPGSGASAVVLNVTVTSPTSTGVVTVYAHGAALPGTSNMDFVRGQTVPNLVIAPMGTGGMVDLHVASAGTVQLIADVFGYFSAGGAASPGSYQPLAATRVLDTRSGVGGTKATLDGSNSLTLPIAGRNGVPSVGVAAVALNVTVTTPNSPGVVSVSAYRAALPATSNLNFVPRQTVANLVIAPLSVDGSINLNYASNGSIELIADVAGYFNLNCSAALCGWGGPSSQLLVRPENVDPATGNDPEASSITALGAPVDVVDNGSAAYALRADGKVLAVGQGDVGELGDGKTTYSATPIVIPSLSSVASIATAGRTAFALVGGQVWDWGSNDYFGQLGDHTTTQSSVPVAVSGLTGVNAIAAGGSDGYALRSDGTVWSWGWNAYGQLGSAKDDPTCSCSMVPVQVTGLSNVVQISSSGSFALALTSNGTVWSWGIDFTSSAGGLHYSDVPSVIGGLPPITTLAAGWENGYAIDANHKLWAWGDGTFGQLGDGTAVVGSGPVLVSALPTVTAVAAGTADVYAVEPDGSVWAWGDNEVGRLGIGTTQNASLPTRVLGLAGVARIFVGAWDAYAQHDAP